MDSPTEKAMKRKFEKTIAQRLWTVGKTIRIESIEYEKTWVTKDNRDFCDINCETGTISYRNSCDINEITELLDLIQTIREQEEKFFKTPLMNFAGMDRYKILSQYKIVGIAFTIVWIKVIKKSKIF